ncbi:enoyl-CoA hydratase/isomerase family protein [Ramlibacter sp.]|uniref:enoyl-CoA hydratase/isomerase family protein n=1 Tax=Ramlibacter sp. TaxID=1917967 RepID=UPI003D10A51C
MTGIDYATLKIDPPREHVQRVALNRPEAMNAVDTQMGRDLLDYFARLTAEPGDVRCVLLTGTGGKAFCAGGDLKERNGMSAAQWQAQHELFERAFVTMMECPVPIVAALNGIAYGGGLEMALTCDFIYAARGARFALSEVRLGLMPGGCGTQNLARAVGERRAKELVLTGSPFTAEEGVAWGAFNRACDPASLEDEALATARTIAGNAPLSVRQAKKSIHYGMQMDLLTGYRFEIEAYNRLVDTEDRHEGVRAFNEKRKPDFKGR